MAFPKLSVPKSIQDFLIRTFPEVDFDFNAGLGKFGIKEKDVGKVKYTQISKAAAERVKDSTYELKTPQEVAGIMTEKARLKTQATRVKQVGYFKNLAKWIETNAAKYSDVDKFYKDALKKFDAPEYKGFITTSIQTSTSVKNPQPLGKFFDVKKVYKEGDTFNYKNLFELKGADAGSKVRYVKDMMLINMMEKNPKMEAMKDNMVKILKNDLSALSAEDIANTKQFTTKNLRATAANPNLLRSYFNSTIKNFEELRQQQPKFSKSVEAQLRTALKRKGLTDAFRKKITTTLSNISRGKKYGIQLRNEFKELFGKDKPVYASTVKKGKEFFEFEHKVGKASTGINKLPATYLIRGTYVPTSFNYAKNMNFDNKLLGLMNEYKETKSAAIETKIKKLRKDFNKKSAGYLNDLTIDFDRKAGSVIVTDKTPIFKIKDYDDYKQQFARNLKHSQAYLSTIKGGKYAYPAKPAAKLIALADKNVNNICSILGRSNRADGGIGCAGQMAKALDEDPIGIATKTKDLKVEGGAVNRVKSAAIAFLKFAGKGKVFGASAVAGALSSALVKQFQSDDPETYLTNDKQANAMILDTADQLEREERMEAMGDAPELLDDAAIAAEVGAMGAAIPGSGAVYKARRKPFTKTVDGVKKTRAAMGPARAALGPVGKALSGFATPLGLAAITPLNVANQVYAGDSAEEIATDPLNWLGPAFAGTLTDAATQGMKDKSVLARTLRLGMSPAAIRTASRFLGLPGLAFSLGYEGYDQYKKYTEGRGFVYNLMNK